MGIKDLESVANAVDSANNVIKSIIPSECELRKQYVSCIIEDINKSEKLGIFEKGAVAEAVIKNSKLLKKRNTEDILLMATNILKEKDIQLLKGISEIDTNWMLEFLDNCENTTDSDMKKIWAKILSSECENPGSVSKRLLGILRIIDKRIAEKFGIICSHTLELNSQDGVKPIQFIFPTFREKKI